MRERRFDEFVLPFVVKNDETRSPQEGEDGLVCREIPEKHLLGYLDSNQEQKNQNLPCCQLHHTPPKSPENKGFGMTIQPFETTR